MTTKQQERKALDMIKKIVAGLGEDSYIATAFAGCFEDAERNISDDAAYSMKDRVEMLTKKNAFIGEENKTLSGIIKNLKAEVEKQRKRADENQENAELWQRWYKESGEKASKTFDALSKQTEKNEQLEQEIIKLKAKLYDCMEASK